MANALPDRGFRAERPVAARSGAWAVNGWAAWRRVEGSHDFSRWPEVIAAAGALHDVLRGIPRPDFLDHRDQPWARADRVAWGEAWPVMGSVDLQICAIRLARHVRRTALPAQVVHGDVTGNVLFTPGSPPAVIDLTPYWRPMEYALAIVAVDAICWHGAGPQILEMLPAQERSSMIARAALFRLFTADLIATGRLRGDGAYLTGQVEAADRVGDLLDQAPWGDRDPKECP